MKRRTLSVVTADQRLLSPLPPDEPPAPPPGRTDLTTARRYELLELIPGYWTGRERTRVTLAGEHDDLSEEQLRQLRVANSYFSRARELEGKAS